MDRRGYLRHFAILMSGTGVAQLVTFASYAALARLYTPSDFGVLALFTTAVTIVGAIASARFEIAIPVVRDSARSAVLWLCVLLNLLAAALATAVATLWYAITGPPPVPVLPLLVGLGVFLTGFTAASSSYLLRNDHYGWVSRTLVLRSLGVAAVQIGLAFLYGGAVGLIVGYGVGLLLQALWLGSLLRRTGWRKRPRARHLRAVFQRHRRQAGVDVPSSLLSTISATILNVTLLFLYNEAVVGFYALANRLIVVPLKTVNDGLARVFFQKAAQAQERFGSFWREMKFNLIISGAFSLGVMIFLWIFARPLISVYLGEDWLLSADLLVIMAPMLALRSIASSISTTVFVLRRAQWRLYHNIAYIALHGLAFALTALLNLDLFTYFVLFTILLGLELAGWILVLSVAAYRSSEAGDLRRRLAQPQSAK